MPGELKRAAMSCVLLGTKATYQGSQGYFGKSHVGMESSNHFLKRLLHNWSTANPTLAPVTSLEDKIVSKPIQFHLLSLF